MVILGIDPGANTGVATFVNGKLTELDTVQPHRIAGLLDGVSRVVFEDSRLQSFGWSAKGLSRAAALKVARDIGEIDAWCRLILAHCGDKGIPAHGISPLRKGAKLGAEEFKRITGWTGRSNEHERDAAMLAWGYRGAAA